MERKIVIRHRRGCKLLTFILAGMVFVSIAAPAFSQSKDPLIGTWVLDLGKSTFMPDNPPQKRTLIFAAKDNGIRCVIRTVTNGGLDNGMTGESEFTAKYDGKDYDISESLLDTVSLKKIDANTIERTGKIRGKAVETATMKLGQDGKVLTVTTKGEINGTGYGSTQVYARQ